MGVIFESNLFKCNEISPENFEIDFGERKSKNITAAGDYSALFELQRKICIKGAVFTITGRNTVIAYFAAAYYLTLGGAKKILCRRPNLKEYLLPSDSSCATEKKWLSCKPGVIEILPNPDALDHKWGELTLTELAVPADISSACIPGKDILLTGQGPVLMYAALGVVAATAGERCAFQLSIPSSPVDLIFAPGKYREKHVVGDKKGKVVGIIGDPNSGKSVFSSNFVNALKNGTPDNFTSWIKDCDMSAPTPGWYLQNPDPASHETMLRKKMKDDWDEELENMARKDLLLLRSRLDLLIADMPGGKHPKDPAERDKAERIPGAGRARMFDVCDYFIILCRNGEDYIFKAWVEALHSYGLENRILARFNTYVSPKGQRVFRMTPIHRGTKGFFESDIWNLDREENEPEQIIQAMTDAGKALFNFLVEKKESSEQIS